MLNIDNLIRTGTMALRAHISGGRLPLNVMLSLTNQCTSRCSYCSIPARKQRELTTLEVFDLIDQIGQMGATRLGLWGGEPLIRGDVGDIVDYAKEKGLFVTLDTNGYLIPEKLREIRNIDHLLVAFDGLEEAHDINREKGSFKKVMRAFEVISRKIPMWTITVLTKYNIESVDYILQTAERFGFLTTFQVVHHNEKLGRDLVEFLPSPEAYREAFLYLIKRKREGAPIASSFNYLHYLSTWPDFTRPSDVRKRDNLACLAGRLFCNVDVDGSVYPCPLLIEKFPAKNFLASSFKNVYDSLGPLPCRSCDGGCCVEYNYLYSLNLSSIFDWIRAMHLTRKNLNGRGN